MRRLGPREPSVLGFAAQQRKCQRVHGVNREAEPLTVIVVESVQQPGSPRLKKIAMIAI
jgi:hypothetical protein